MQKIHFIGIGGIGISALARFLKEKGFIISGSDLKRSKITDQLESEGVKVSIPHRASNVKGKDLIIYSAAIKEENAEFKEANKLGIKCLSRKEALPLILKDKRVFAIAGAHGKSTTSSIMASLLPQSSVIIGAILKEFGSNMIYKENENLVFEADESDSSFLNSNPYLAIVTNVEAEHLEHYDNEFQKLQNAYLQFLQTAKKRVINVEDEYLATLDIDAIRLYPSKDIKNVRMSVENFKPQTCFELKDLGTFCINGMGKHLAIDAALAILALIDEYDINDLRTRLKNYQGIKKRFDILHANEKLAIIDDYGHHPTEIATTLIATKEYAKLAKYNKITAIFQPHRYTRLAANLQAFADSFKEVDELFILPVYAAGEKKIVLDIKKYFPNAIFIKDIKREGDYLVTNKGKVLEEGLIIGFGAGDISLKLRGV
ncbi:MULTISPECIES: UDP-N-acetylmuramate--L-alanine ligase [unclassified Campylobacter]|uniref:UDP-N-acetylmuramate--L-alanine ligase n=1 Tax=unclassified Campylobacter TaxID=2593542 RepID=UPI001237A98E|nr:MULTISPECIES: UDP-N-acetylmuramate--L-alanine ligase [unclassified Campylobacter]KAA6225363.1 UDP-N-acetylmuramate--L-alanine ligase [Campylobacter sp. LR185c]KAA6227059.1 UDP-N-acetylmuramate--L-alanine ligase [Campylobacter sp. LR196d]KAA6227630.1 UDP-N-acetylmuramate--L-alanine ligase [Campylobacter sp. LR286c]KAA6229495.1 UDP-N-acetylmuramate--L-alanine ligase [Campylobacter sp. LR264d]KAA6230739.1 UDP-N-acetylmuramate--L-alanine ligase [Campylobacter sp. LR291e]